MTHSLRFLLALLLLTLLPALTLAQPFSVCCCILGNIDFSFCADGESSGSVIATCENQGGIPLGDPIDGVSDCNLGSSEQCISECANLPVELTHFTATTTDDGIHLAWSTASETNNAGFDIELERGSTWQRLDFVAGYGTTLEGHAYTYTVTDLDPGVHRFRLRQVDFDGAATFSPVVEAVLEVPGQYVMKPAYPNPFNPTTTVSFAVAGEQFVRVVLYDVLGRQVREAFAGEVSANAMQTVRIEAVGLPNGSYLVQLEGETFRASQRVLLLQ